MQCRLLPARPGVTAKRYPYLAIQYLRHGRMRLSIAGRSRVVQAPCVWFGYPGAAYRMTWLEATGERWFVGCWGPPVDAWLAAPLLSRQVHDVVEVEELDARLRLLQPLDGCREAGERQRATLLVEELLRLLAGWRGQAAADADWPQAVYDQITGNLSQEPDAAAIARSLGIGESTVRRRFREAIGLPIHQAWLQARVQAACRLLLTTDEPIAGVAQRSGFDDPAYFSRCFHRQIGMSPRTFRLRNE